MRFAEYLTKLPSPAPDAAKLDRAARRAGGARDPLSTAQKRVVAQRAVEEVEQIVGPIDVKKDDWPDVVAKVVSLGHAERAALSGADDLIPSKKASKRGR